MKRSGFSDQDIVRFLKEAEAGVPLAELCRIAGVSQRTFYRWRERFGSLEPASVGVVRSLHAENRRLRGIIEDLVRGPSNFPATGHLSSPADTPTRPALRNRVAYFPGLRGGQQGRR